MGVQISPRAHFLLNRKLKFCFIYGGYGVAVAVMLVMSRGLQNFVLSQYGGYGVAVAQRLVEPLARVRSPIATPIIFSLFLLQE